MLQDLLWWHYVMVAVIGLIAGTLGGMLGVGGSVIMIPGLTIVFGREQHLWQAAAMVANVFVAVPAAWRHYRAGGIVNRALFIMLPVALVTVVAGVWLSNTQLFSGRDGALWLSRLLSVFLVYVIVVNVKRIIRPRRQQMGDFDPRHITWPRAGAVGATLGGTAGLLGIGGGAIAVPLQQVLLKLPLKNCIANSSAIICLSASLGAVYKNLTITQHVSTMGDVYGQWSGVILGGLLAPTAMVGGYLGATLTHRLPTRQVRVVFVLLMIAAAWKMSALPSS